MTLYRLAALLYAGAVVALIAPMFAGWLGIGAFPLSRAGHGRNVVAVATCQALGYGHPPEIWRGR